MTVACPSAANLFAVGQTVKTRTGAGGGLDGKPDSLIWAAISGTIKLCPIRFLPARPADDPGGSVDDRPLLSRHCAPGPCAWRTSAFTAAAYPCLSCPDTAQPRSFPLANRASGETCGGQCLISVESRAPLFQIQSYDTTSFLSPKCAASVPDLLPPGFPSKNSSSGEPFCNFSENFWSGMFAFVTQYQKLS